MRHCSFVALSLAALVGCGSSLRHIAVDKMPLGKVVVYRNGVAYYERRAQVTAGKLTVRVPRDRVDDFLKSLTVVDARTHTPLPVAFPRRQADDAPVIEMQLDVGIPDGTTADVLMTYVTDAVAWKPSYRLVLGDDDAMLEGWAVVDNLSGEDWRQVEVGVGSSAAMSFRYDLWSVRTVDREQLAADEVFATAPPTAVSPYGGPGGAGEVQNLLILDANEIRDVANLPPSETIVVTDRAPTIDPASTTQGITADYTQNIPTTGRSFEATLGTAAGSSSDGVGVSFSGSSSLENQYVVEGVNTTGTGYGGAAPRIDPYQAVKLGDAKLAAVASGLIQQRQYVVVQGFASPRDPNPAAAALDRANLVRNQLIDAGVAPGRVRVESRGVSASANVQIVTETAPPEASSGGAHAAGDTRDGTPIGESLFQSRVPMNVNDGSSAMVSVLRTKTRGRTVYLYDGDGERGNARYAFKAVRLENPTDQTLEAGPITVYGADRYIGEGLTDTVAPNAAVVVPYALDRQIVVDRDGRVADELSRLVTLERGILTAEVQHVRTTALTLTNRSTVATTVYVRHALEPGWKLIDNQLPVERIGGANLVAVDLEPGASRTIELRDATPMTRRLELGATDTLEQLKVFVASPHPSAQLRDQLRAMLAIHADLFDQVDRIATLRDHAIEYRERQAELTEQLVALRKLKTATSLSRQLADKAADISTRLQATTVAIVEAQDRVMLLRVEFQDALAELHLDDARATVALAP